MFIQKKLLLARFHKTFRMQNCQICQETSRKGQNVFSQCLKLARKHQYFQKWLFSEIFSRDKYYAALATLPRKLWQKRKIFHTMSENDEEVTVCFPKIFLSRVRFTRGIQFRQPFEQLLPKGLNFFAQGPKMMNKKILFPHNSF